MTRDNSIDISKDLFPEETLKQMRNIFSKGRGNIVETMSKLPLVLSHGDMNRTNAFASRGGKVPLL
jgi:hypothetical protein